MGLNLDFNDAEMPGQSEKFPRGIFEVKICKIVFKESHRMRGVMFFICELEVISGDNLDVKPGSRRSWTANTSHQPTPGNIKQFLCAAVGIDPTNNKHVSEVKYTDGRPVDWNALADWAVGEANPLMGRVLMLETNPTITEKNKQEFMVHRWEPSDEPMNFLVLPS